MKPVEDLVKTSMVEIERLLNTKTVVGEPLTYEGTTIVPLVSVGFGFAVGGGAGNQGSGGTQKGSGMGAGGGGGVKPVAVIIIDKDGVRLETLHGSGATVAEKVVDVVGKAVAGRYDAPESSQRSSTASESQLVTPPEPKSPASKAPTRKSRARKTTARKPAAKAPAKAKRGTGKAT